MKPEAQSLPRRGLSRVAAAIYVGVSPTKFDQLVTDGRMPGPRRIDGRKVWDVRELDSFFDDLPQQDSAGGNGHWCQGGHTSAHTSPEIASNTPMVPPRLAHPATSSPKSGDAMTAHKPASEH